MVDLITRISANVLTVCNVILGSSAIVYTLNENYTAAGILILVAVVIDGLDGKVARKFHSASEFGKQLDSLCDLVSFGVAPAVLLYALSLADFNLIGLTVTILFIVCGALRLARFNISSTSSFFLGVPITMAGGILAIVSMLPVNQVPVLVIVFILSLLMISTVRIPKI